MGLGFVTGFGLQRGALASSIAHDAHNVVVVGSDDADMAAAVNRLVEIGGGQVAVAGGEVLAEVPCPIGGLLSDRTVEEVAGQVELMERVAREDFGPRCRTRSWPCRSWPSRSSPSSSSPTGGWST